MSSRNQNRSLFDENGIINDYKPSSEDISTLISYFNNPVSSGVWRLNIEWIKNDGISEILLNEIINNVDEKDNIIYRSGKREIKIKIDDDFKNKLSEKLRNSVSFYFRLFSYISRHDSKNIESDLSLESEGDLVTLVLDLVDISLIKEKYRDAAIYFKDEIWFPEISSTIWLNNFSCIKDGIFMALAAPKEDNIFTAMSWSMASLKKLSVFLSLLGKVNKKTLAPIFSPEEEVFEPYFSLLEMAYPYIVKQEHIRPVFHRVFMHYNDENYSDCVSAIGIIAEDILTQIYETLFRDHLTKGLTLGQLVDTINNRVESLYENKEVNTPEFSSLYDDINKALENDSDNSKEALHNLRKLLTMIIANNKSLNQKIDGIGKPKSNKLIFSKRVYFHLNELIKYRNASSHKSRIPIGNYESVRSIHSLMVVLMWWDNEKSNIDWEHEPDNIIKGIVERNY